MGHSLFLLLDFVASSESSLRRDASRVSDLEFSIRRVWKEEYNTILPIVGLSLRELED